MDGGCGHGWSVKGAEGGVPYAYAGQRGPNGSTTTPKGTLHFSLRGTGSGRGPWCPLIGCVRLLAAPPCRSAALSMVRCTSSWVMRHSRRSAQVRLALAYGIQRTILEHPPPLHSCRKRWGCYSMVRWNPYTSARRTWAPLREWGRYGLEAGRVHRLPASAALRHGTCSVLTRLRASTRKDGPMKCFKEQALVTVYRSPPF